MPSSKTILRMLEKIETQTCRSAIQKQLNIQTWQTIYYWKAKQTVPVKYWHIIREMYERT